MFAIAYACGSNFRLPSTRSLVRQTLLRSVTTVTPETKLAVGRSFERLEVLSAGRVSRFVAVTGDSNPIHAGDGAIVPGSLCAAMFPAIIGSEFPGAIYLSQTLKFRKKIQAQVGTAVRAIVTVERISGNRVVFHTVCRTTGSKTCEVVDGQAFALFPA